MRRSDLRRCLLWLAAILVLHPIFAAVGLPYVVRANAGDWDLSFPTAPETLQASKDALDRRHTAVVNFLACGRQVEFLNALLGQNSRPSEGLSAILLAKIEFLSGASSFDRRSLQSLRCHGSSNYWKDDPAWKNFIIGGREAVEASLANLDPDCADSLLALQPREDGLSTLTFEVNGNCMRKEVNRMISILGTPDQLGSSGLPCISGFASDLMIPPIVPHDSPALTTEGELDVHVRDYTRMFFLHRDKPILDQDVRDHIRDKLMIAWGPLGPETYSVLDCGNTEHSEGTPQDLLDERDFLDETLDDLGDLGLWLLKRLALFAFLLGPVASVLGALANLIGAGAAVPALIASPATIAAIGAVAGGEIRAGETENHRLMIETSRYLKNQVIIEQEADHPNISDLQEDQDDLKKWLLDYMGLILRHDFSEYNARPYQRYSLLAILNLADYATDTEVRDAARMVLEFAMGKFAISSRESVRVVPYRRLVELMTRNPAMLVFGGDGTDFSISMMMYWTGLVNRFETFQPISEGPRFAELPYGNPAAMIHAATSSFTPDDAILNLAIDKSRPYLQRFRSEGVEVYWSTPSFTIAAGGIVTPQALTLMLGPVGLGLGRQTDKGTGVPTAFIPAATRHNNRLEFMGFEGEVEDFGADGRTYDHNVCVWEGFACGINYRDMADFNTEDTERGMEACWVLGENDAPAEWTFLNSKECAATKAAPAFFIARYLRPCADEDAGCLDNRRFGFFEAVDAPTADFASFKAAVIAANPTVYPAGLSDEDAVTRDGTYMTTGGKRIVFNAAAHQEDSDDYGIRSVDGRATAELDDWPLAEGTVMSGRDGKVSFTDPNTGRTLTWDLSDAQHPKRTPPF